MNLKMGSQVFVNVKIPLLWGTRAVVQDESGRLSVIDLAGDTAKLEILGDKPAPGAAFLPTIDGYTILSDDKQLYTYNPKEKTLIGIDLGLPECQIKPWEIRVGSNVFSGSTIAGFGVGVAVQENGISIGSRLPPGLTKLVV
jgi:hypothetical protein